MQWIGSDKRLQAASRMKMVNKRWGSPATGRRRTDFPWKKYATESVVFEGIYAWIFDDVEEIFLDLVIVLKAFRFLLLLLLLLLLLSSRSDRVPFFSLSLHAATGRPLSRQRFTPNLYLFLDTVDLIGRNALAFIDSRRPGPSLGTVAQLRPARGPKSLKT